MNIVFKISENIKPKMINYYSALAKPSKPPYTIFQAVDHDTTITLYESGKVMFQGISADVDANIWMEMEKKFNHREIILPNKKTKISKVTLNKNYLNFDTIGSDEVGTGDYFGPIVVSAAYVARENFDFLINLGVRDSKKLTDNKICLIAPQLIKKIPYLTIVLSNLSYNKHYQANFNLNKIKAVLHNKVLAGLLNQDKYNYEKIIVDQFVYPAKYYQHLKEAKKVVRNITFLTQAESKCLSVAVASIISRYVFINKINEIQKELKLPIPKGAGAKVDQTGLLIVQKYGLSKLREIAKLNFKNTQKIKEKLELSSK